jgi:hypothetical protein
MITLELQPVKHGIRKLTWLPQTSKACTKQESFKFNHPELDGVNQMRF